MARRHLTGLLLAAFSLGPAAATPPATSIIPAESDELRYEGIAAIYPGDMLFDYINGGAPQYIEFGFAAVASQEIIFRGHTYIFDVYAMESPLAAFGIFSGRRPTGAPVLGDFPYSSFTTYQGMLVLGPYLIDITAYDSSPETAAEMSALGRLAAAQIAPASLADDLTHKAPFAWLPQDGRHPGTEKLARGPISLRAAMGGHVSGASLAAIEAAQVELAGNPATANPWWVVCGYHPRTDEDNALSPQTWVVLLVNHGDFALPGGIAPIEAAVAGALRETRGAWPQNDRMTGWTADDGRSGCVLPLATHLAFIASRLERATLETWARSLTP